MVILGYLPWREAWAIVRQAISVGRVTRGRNTTVQRNLYKYIYIFISYDVYSIYILSSKMHRV